MAKKRNKKKKGYFFRGFSVDTNDLAITSIKSATARMGMSNLRLLDQTTMTQETFISLLFIWADMAVRERGVAFFERELADPLKVLEPYVAKEKALADALESEQRARADEVEEGFSGPKPKGPKGGNSKGKPGGRP